MEMNDLLKKILFKWILMLGQAAAIWFLLDLVVASAYEIHQLLGAGIVLFLFACLIGRVGIYLYALLTLRRG